MLVAARVVQVTPRAIRACASDRFAWLLDMQVSFVWQNAPHGAVDEMYCSVGVQDANGQVLACNQPGPYTMRNMTTAFTPPWVGTLLTLLAHGAASGAVPVTLRAFSHPVDESAPGAHNTSSRPTPLGANAGGFRVFACLTLRLSHPPCPRGFPQAGTHWRRVWLLQARQAVHKIQSLPDRLLVRDDAYTWTYWPALGFGAPRKTSANPSPECERLGLAFPPTTCALGPTSAKQVVFRRWGSAVACAAWKPHHTDYDRCVAALFEALCLRTETWQEGGDPLDIAVAGEDITAGCATVGVELFVRGVACQWWIGEEVRARSILIGRRTRSSWMSEPASEAVFGTDNPELAYADRGGHMVVCDIAKDHAASFRVANPSRHDAPVGCVGNCVFSCHSGLMSGTWRPQSAAAFAARMADGTLAVAKANQSYVLCSTWRGQHLWLSPVPSQPLSCACFESALFVGSLDGVLQLSLLTGHQLRLISRMPCVQVSVFPFGQATLLACVLDDGNVDLLQRRSAPMHVHK